MKIITKIEIETKLTAEEEAEFKMKHPNGVTVEKMEEAKTKMTQELNYLMGVNELEEISVEIMFVDEEGE